MRVLTASQSHDLDRIASKNFNIPARDLMKNAGRRLAEIVKEQIDDQLDAGIAIVCGKGSNGGDGYAAACFLVEWGFQIDVFSTVQARTIQNPAKMYLTLLEQKGEKVRFLKSPPRKHDPYQVCVDSVLGTGIKGKVQRNTAVWLKWINSLDSMVVSADIASGLDADVGFADPSTVKADVTVTMGYPKLGMCINQGPEYCGQIIPADIGFPDLPDNLAGTNWSLFDESDVYQYLPPLKKDTYKHHQGKVLVLAGSTGMTGAAVLSSMAALCSGAGLVKTFAPQSLNPIYEIKMTEVMTIPCEDDGRGFFSLDNLELINDHLEWCDVLIIGPGLGTNEETQALVKALLTSASKPIVVDADGLCPSFGNLKLIKEINAPFVMTPHYGELSKMMSITVPDLKSELPDHLVGVANNMKGVLVAKNAPTICSQADRGVINSSGNQGLATAGTGDVLTGIIASLMAQGLNPFEAAQLGVFLHGKAADLTAQDTGQHGLVASDLLYSVSKAINEYE